MATLKAIRRRITSVQSTQQITRAMKLVSAAKLRRAQEALLNARPYVETLARVADSVLAAERTALASAEGAAPVALVVVIGSDRGLNGGYNANLIRTAEATARDLHGAGQEPGLFVVGRKILDHFRRVRLKTAGERINNLPRLATLDLARDIGDQMLAEFRSGKISEAGIVYSRFRSALSQVPTYERILPISNPEPKEQDAPAQPLEYLIEPSRAELVPVVLQSYVQYAVFHALLEAEASEQAARMTAMDAATNNASDMISSLTLEMNRARQASITRELMDIVGGAEALRG
ncbi:MAG TPA: ATP synthase F1 subunit gamma [Candidatus Binataceae bacterium]|nr:ATP synthase F1 subunit gamma [Candidatus Binataceae bacterium]